MFNNKYFQYYTKCTTGPTNPFHGAISFDNIGLAWVAIFLVISLEGWTDVMYFVQDAHSFWNWIYFVCLIVVSFLSLSSVESLWLSYRRLAHSLWLTCVWSSSPPSSLKPRNERQLRWRQREPSSPPPPLCPPSLTGWSYICRSVVHQHSALIKSLDWRLLIINQLYHVQCLVIISHFLATVLLFVKWLTRIYRKI